MMWQSQVSTKKNTYGDVNGEGYGLGWTVMTPYRAEGGGRVPPLVVNHGGGAVGATSILVLLPAPPDVANSNDTVRAMLCINNYECQSLCGYVLLPQIGTFIVGMVVNQWTVPLVCSQQIWPRNRKYHYSIPVEHTNLRQ